MLKGRLTQKSIPHIIEHEEHLALYFRGIGNDDDNSMLGSFYYGVFGGSEKRIRDHAYVSIVEHYRKGTGSVYLVLVGERPRRVYWPVI